MWPCANYSKDSLSPQWELQNFPPLSFGLSIVVCLFMVIGLPWNLLAIAMLLKSRLFRQPTMLLFLNLAITDLLICAYSLPLNATTGLAGEFVFGGSDYVRCVVCQMGTFNNALLLMSVYNIVLLSLDRFLYVKLPLKYGEVVTMRRVFAVLVVFWSAFIGFSLLPFFGFGRISFVDILAECTIVYVSMGLNTDYVYLWITVILLCGLPVVILFFLKTWMLCIMVHTYSQLYQHERSNVTTGTSARQPSLLAALRRKYTKPQLHLLWVFLVIFTLDLLTWLPTVVSLGLVTGRVIVPWYVIVAQLCLLSQAALHPIIQVIFLKDVRLALKSSLCCRKQPPQRSSTLRKTLEML